MKDYLTPAEMALDILKAHISLNVEGLAPEMDSNFVKEQLRNMEELKIYIQEHYNGELSQSIAVHHIQIDIQIKVNNW